MMRIAKLASLVRHILHLKDPPPGEDVSITDEAQLSKRTLILSGICDGDIQQKICAMLTTLNLISDEGIRIYIDTYGGGIHSARHLHDAIRSSKAPVTGIVMGRAVSAGFVALMACKHKAAFPNANLMYHAPGLVGLRIDNPDLEEEIAELRTFHDSIIEELVRPGKAPRSKFEELSRDEIYFNARQALEWGVVDEIL